MAKTRQQHRIGLIVFVVAAAATCLLLGYWQLSRFDSATGTARNLGYAFQWPAFAAFFIYAYRRFIRLEADLEAERGEDDESGSDALTDAPIADQPTAPTPSRKKIWVDRDKSKMTEIPEYLLPKREPTSANARTAAEPDTGASGAVGDEASGSLHEYNDYLARLSARDTEGQRR